MIFLFLFVGRLTILILIDGDPSACDSVSVEHGWKESDTVEIETFGSTVSCVEHGVVKFSVGVCTVGLSYTIA